MGTQPSDPTDRWPTRAGFDEFYGFMGGETNQWAPFLFHGTNPVEVPKDPNYHFMTDMTNKAISLAPRFSAPPQAKSF